MFSTKEFIDVSRKFVCVRIDSYESQEHQEWVRRFLNGRFENTAFCVLTPDGKDWLTSASRSPLRVFGKDASVQGMAAIAEKYPVKFDRLQAVVQDFHSVGQALNVASADQRLLVLVSGPEVKLANARESLKPVVNSADFLGRLHVDFETGDAWSKAITNEQSSEGIMFIAAGEFGLHGAVLSQLPLDATHTQVREALIKANKTFTATTRLKNYMEHVQKGNLLGIRYKSAVPYGEDRNGDGQIDRPADGRRLRPR